MCALLAYMWQYVTDLLQGIVLSCGGSDIHTMYDSAMVVDTPCNMYTCNTLLERKQCTGSK